MATEKDLILITIDCMRADFLNERMTPSISGLGTRGTVYTSAYANGCGTPDSFPALLASRLSHPYAHRPTFDSDREWMLRRGDITLAEALASAGYETAAFVGGNPYLGRRYGYHRGFDVYEDSQPGALIDRVTGGRLRGAMRRMAHRLPWSPYPKAENVTRGAVDWLSARTTIIGPRQPFFLWVHYMDAHFPNLPPGEHSAKERRAAWSPVTGDAEKHHEVLVKLYERSLTYIDSQVARIMSSAPTTSTVAITADHGQLLGEHGSYWHNGVWEQLLRVPLIIAGPAVPRGVVDDMVQLLDLAPHLLKLLAIQPPETWEGTELHTPNKPIYAISNSESRGTYADALIGVLRKVIRTPDGVWEYDRIAEPPDMVLGGRWSA